jgi:enediyne biosynthesis protein E4
MDLAFGNWGRNSPYESFAKRGIRIYYRDFSGAGRIDGVESYFEGGRELPWRDLERMSMALPWLRGRFTSYAQYGSAGFAEVMADSLTDARRLEATVFDSMLFLNRGQRFEPRSLPVEAQLAPVFGLVAGDFDGDGSHDLVVAQNFFAVDADSSRYDAGLGLVMRGNARGELSAVSPRLSGLRIYGDQRGAAAADYNHDGRLDLAVGQNRAATRLFRNHIAKPALRVNLAGPAGNEAAVGAMIRRVDGARRGPAQEIRAGNGWWSQDSSTVLLSGTGTNIWVRWPSGQETISPIPPGASSLMIHMDGNVSR